MHDHGDLKIIPWPLSWTEVRTNKKTTSMKILLIFYIIFRLHPKTTDFVQNKFFSFFFKQRKNKQIKKYYNIFDQYRP